MRQFLRNIVLFIDKRFDKAIFFKDTNEKVVALTIDDIGGLDTLKFLRVIDEFNDQLADDKKLVKATFFIITSNLDDSKEMVNEILKRGHEIGNHGHVDRRHASIDTVDFECEFRRAHRLLTEGTRVQNLQWFRPGQAFYNKGMVKTLDEQNGYKKRFPLASMLPLDTFFLTGASGFTYRYISNFIFEGSILVLHGGRVKVAENSSEALRRLLPDLIAEGYLVTTLSDLMRD